MVNAVKKQRASQYPKGTQLRTVNGQVTAVYIPKTEEEGERRWKRAKESVGQGFDYLPGYHPNPNETFRIGGEDIPLHIIERTYNDGQLCDFVSDGGKDGPLYRDTIDGIQLEVYEWAVARYSAHKATEERNKTND